MNGSAPHWLLAILLLILTTGTIIGQRETDGTRTINLLKLYISCPAFEFDLIDDTIVPGKNGVIIYAPAYLSFIQTQNNGDIIVQLIHYDFNNDYKFLTNHLPKLTSLNKSKEFYLIKKEDAESKIIKHHSTSLFKSKTQGTWFDGTSLSLGVITIPYKLRFQYDDAPFSFSPSISLGTTLGIKQRVSKTYLAYLNGIVYTGLSSVELNNSNSNPNLYTLSSSSRNEAAFTFALGIMYTVNSIQVGVILGKDYISNQTTINWAYHNKYWFAVGIGTQIFNLSK